MNALQLTTLVLFLSVVPYQAAGSPTAKRDMHQDPFMESEKGVKGEGFYMALTFVCRKIAFIPVGPHAYKRQLLLPYPPELTNGKLFDEIFAPLFQTLDQTCEHLNMLLQALEELVKHNPNSDVSMPTDMYGTPVPSGDSTNPPFYSSYHSTPMMEPKHNPTSSTGFQWPTSYTMGPKMSPTSSTGNQGTQFTMGAKTASTSSMESQGTTNFNMGATEPTAAPFTKRFLDFFKKYFN